MPFELSNSLKNTCGWSFASKGMNGLFGSKFYTTAILTSMIIVLIMILYPCQKNTPVWILGKLGFYIFVVTLGIIFVHDCVVYHNYEKETHDTETDEFIGGLDGRNNIAFSGDGDRVDISIDNVSNKNKDNKPGENHSTVVGGDSDSVFDMYGV